jgi:hypothetical protein
VLFDLHLFDLHDICWHRLQFFAFFGSFWLSVKNHCRQTVCHENRHGEKKLQCISKPSRLSCQSILDSPIFEQIKRLPGTKISMANEDHFSLETRKFCSHLLSSVFKLIPTETNRSHRCFKPMPNETQKIFFKLLHNHPPPSKCFAPTKQQTEESENNP